MNAEPNVSAKTHERVMAAVTALEYHPNLSARSLAGSRSFLVAALVDEKLTLDHWRTGHGTDYLARIQLGATLACREAGYHLLVVLVDHGTPAGRQQLTRMLATLKPDGVILTPPSADSEVALGDLRRTGTPYVRLGPEHSHGGGLRLSLNDRSAARGMTDYLVSLGHRRIGFIGGDERYGSSRARRDGFTEAMAARGLATPWMPCGDYTFQSGLTCGRAMLARTRRPSAIFASNDEMALGCMAAAAECGLRVPDDVSIAGFDDSGGSRLSRPALTTLRQPIEDMAALAARALIDGSVSQDCDREGGRELPGFALMPRHSTAMLADPRRRVAKNTGSG
jgi:LacI family transcriptional regulator